MHHVSTPLYVHTYVPEPETDLVTEDMPVETTDVTTEITAGEVAGAAVAGKVTEAVVAGDVTNKFTSITLTL